MTENVSAVNARRSLGKLLNLVSLKHEEFVIERAGKPLAKLSPCGTRTNEHHAKLDFTKARGLGKDLWRNINTTEYLQQEREEWDR